MPALANTLRQNEFSPDRDERYHRDISDDFQNDEGQNSDGPSSSGSLFRPGRHNSFSTTQDDGDIDIPNDGGPISQDPPVPNAPTEPVPEPGTMLLMAPAVLGLWKKFRS